MNERGVSRLLAENLAPGPGRGGWHGGPTVVGALRGVTAREAAWRPAPGRHSIWELALHIAYWHHNIARRLGAGTGTPFPRGRANWPSVPEPANEAAWRHDRRLVAEMHGLAARAIASVPPASYGRKPAGTRKWTLGELIVGAAQHEAYHTGQIQLLKRLWSARH
jgi:uncharacterized damage-inducible protein DinB